MKVPGAHFFPGADHFPAITAHFPMSGDQLLEEGIPGTGPPEHGNLPAEHVHVAGNHVFPSTDHFRRPQDHFPMERRSL